MGDPLSPLSPSRINRHTSIAANQKHRSAESPARFQDENRPFNSPSGPPSSPFVEDVSLPPSKFQNASDTKLRSPVKLRNPERPPLTEDALRANNLASSTRSVDEANIDPSIKTVKEDDTLSTVAGEAGFAGMDDTCFSAFSAVPNADMTRFANLGQSPTKTGFASPCKSHGDAKATPRPSSRVIPARPRERETSPTPRQPRACRDDDTTNLLMDFTDHISMPQPSNRSPQRQVRYSPFKPGPHHELSSYAANRRAPSPARHPLPPSTPAEARHLANLLDFDLTPAPTPRSIPSITARELESMKSNFLSQISSLTATLSGREAEVKALSNAVTDAERRVGEALEEIRNERGAKESLQAEKEGFESRQKEMQKVLKDVKDEIIASDREKDSLLQRTQEAEHQRELADARAVEAESKLEGMKARSPESNTQPSENANNPNAEVEAAVTKVAKELHSLYKSKHEAKVTALKKSYSDRWERKVKDLQAKVDELSKENEELRIGRDATMSGVVPGTSLSTMNDSLNQKAEQEGQKRRYEEQKEKLETLEKDLIQAQKDLASAKDEKTALQTQLAASRKETEDLIFATEELMQLSQANANVTTVEAGMEPVPSGTTSQDIKSSLSRSFSGPSSLKAPGFGAGTLSGESRIGRVVAGNVGTFSRDRSGSGLGSRSGIMSNIERMGRGRAAD